MARALAGSEEADGGLGREGATAPAAHTSWSIWGTALWGCTGSTALVDTLSKIKPGPSAPSLAWPVLARPRWAGGCWLGADIPGAREVEWGMGTGSGLVAGEKGRGVEWVGCQGSELCQTHTHRHIQTYTHTHRLTQTYTHTHTYGCSMGLWRAGEKGEKEERDLY